MRKFLQVVLVAMMVVVGGSGGALADPGTDMVVSAMQKTNWDVGPEIVFLQKTTKFVVPEHSQARLVDTTGSYGGGKFAYMFGREMIKYFEANGYPNLRQGLASGATDQIDQIAAKYSFEFVYDGPDNQKAWEMFNNYSSLIRDDLFHWGWVSKSGEGHFIVTTTPKVSVFGVSGDGKSYKLSNPVLEIPTSQWQKNVKPFLDKYGTQGQRI